ncbi:hypothetical protein DFH28DRAFT_1118111 [Melampsora americana]|nr:hypothetical protein DFH28DRAFT_1118111 [Melampsora americana]
MTEKILNQLIQTYLQKQSTSSNSISTLKNIEEQLKKFTSNAANNSMAFVDFSSNHALLINSLSLDRTLQNQIILKLQQPNRQNSTLELIRIRFRLISDWLSLSSLSSSSSSSLVNLSFYQSIHHSILVDRSISKQVFDEEEIIQSIINSIISITRDGRYIIGYHQLIPLIIKLNSINSINSINNSVSAKSQLFDQSARLLISITRFSSPHLTTDDVNQIIHHFILHHPSNHQYHLILNLDYIEALIVFGYVPSRESLIHLVEFVAKVIGSDHHPSSIIEKAKECMKNLIRSPSNQAISSLVHVISESRQRSADVVIGSIRCLREAFRDYQSISNTLTHQLKNHQLKTALSLLSLGLSLVKHELMSFINHTTSISDPQDCQVDYQIEQEIIYLLMDRIHLTIEHQNQVYQPHPSQDPHSSSHLTIEPIQKNEHRHSISTPDFKPLHPSQPVSYPKSNNHQVIKPDDLNSILDLMIAFSDSNLSDWFQSANNPSVDTAHHPLKSFAKLFSIIFHQFTSSKFQPLSAHYNQITIGKYFRLAIRLSQHLPSSLKLILIDQIDAERVCAPDHSHWVSNLNSLLNGFFNFDPPLLSHSTNNTTPQLISDSILSSTPQISTSTQLRLLRLISDVFLSTRDLDDWRHQLLDEVIFPILTRILLLHYYPPFDDSALIDVCMDLIQEILKNELINDLLASDDLTCSPTPSQHMDCNTYDLFRNLLIRAASVDRFYESKEVNELIKSRFQANPSSIVPSNSADSSTLLSPVALPTSISPSKPATTITTTALSSSSPQTSSHPTKPTSHHSACLKRREKLAYKAVITFVKLFQDCLAISTSYSNLQCAAIFKHLVQLLRPAQDPHLGLPNDSSAVFNGNLFSFNDLDHHLKRTSSPSILQSSAKLAILKCLVRLRADEEHRVQFVRDVDIEGLASIIGRVVSRDAKYTAPTEPRAHDRKRGLTPDQNPVTSPTASRLKSRSMSINHPIKKDNNLGDESAFIVLSRKTTATSGMTLAAEELVDCQLWTFPEDIDEFNWPPYIRTQSTHSLVTFDHVTRKDWDPSSEQKSNWPPKPLPQSNSACQHNQLPQNLTILPISDYLAALISILRYDTDWELVSYVLCHLPGQLSNKHFVCGPNASQQIHQLRRFLCSGIKLDKLLVQVRFPPQQKVKLTDAHAITYQTLSTLIAYKALFDKAQADELVGSFVTGLGKYKDTAKACIHALSLSCHELPLSITKYLPEILRGLMRIVSSAFVSVHILELLGFLGQMPTLYANLTEEEFKMIFGIALQYITNHNQQTLLESKNSVPSSPHPGSKLANSHLIVADNNHLEDDVQLAFRQYVYLMAFYVISLWFVSLKLPDRRKYVRFITRKLIQACEGKAELDEPTEVCFDMLNRYTYSNAEPKPRKKHSKFNEVIHSSLGKPIRSSSWLVGSSILTIKCLSRPGWTEVCVKRPSGMVKMIWELENLSGDHAASEYDVLDMVIRHRDTLYSSAFDEDGWNPTQYQQNSSSDPDQEFDQLNPDLNELIIDQGLKMEKVREIKLDSILSQSSEITRTTGIEPNYTNLVVEPSFFALQLLPFSDSSSLQSSSSNTAVDFKPMLIPDLPLFQRTIDMIDRIPVVEFHKLGVVYVGPGQRTEEEILGNLEGSKAYIDFLSSLGTLIRLKGCEHYNTGGLDVKSDENGRYGYVWGDDITQVAFHVATLMPIETETTEGQKMNREQGLIRKKALIGNDFVVIVFNESGTDYKFDCLSSAFNFINIIIEPNTPRTFITSNDLKFYKVSLQLKPGLPAIGPIENFKLVSSSIISEFIRRISINANTFVQVYLGTVGTGNRKLEYVSHWRGRLREIKRLKERVMKFELEKRSKEEHETRDARRGGGGGENNGVRNEGEFDVDGLVDLRDFSLWTG